MTTPEETFPVRAVPVMTTKRKSVSESPSPAASAAVRTPVKLPDANGREGLLSRSFLGLLLTQFLGALNDNLFRWLVAWIGGARAAGDPVFRWFASWLNPHLSQKQYEELAVSAGLAMLVLPYLLLAAPAGYLADRFSKRNVIVTCKVAEIVLMLLGMVAILYGSVWLMFVILFLMGSQSALFSPSKYGSIPEIVRAERLPMANGLIALTTIMAIVFGAVGAGTLYEWTKPLGTTNWGLWAGTILSVAGVGLLTSLAIRRLPVADRQRRLPLNPFAETYRDFRTLVAARALFLAALASAVFWSLGGLCQINVNGFGLDHLHLTRNYIGVLLGVLAIGVGAGNVVAGVVARGKIPFALVPLGAAGIALSHIAFFWIPPLGEAPGSGSPSAWPYVLTAFCLFVLGFSGGMYEVPLQSFLQYRSPEKTRGSIFAAMNFLIFSGTLAASGVYILMISVLQWSSQTIFLTCGVLLLPLVVVAVRLLPYDTTRLAAVTLMRLLYRIRVEGAENIPTGGALLTPNHVSYVDGGLIGLNCPRDPRFLVDISYFETPWLAWLGRLARVIPIKPGKKSIVASLRTAREALKAGELVCVFPEGGITRTGQMHPFQPGILTILKGTDAPVIPVHIDGIWGSIFSFEGGRALWKFPKTLFRRRLTLRFGPPIYHPADAEQIHQAVVELGERREE